jgi:hypothetical protein
MDFALLRKQADFIGIIQSVLAEKPWETISPLEIDDFRYWTENNVFTNPRQQVCNWNVNSETRQFYGAKPETG